MNSKHDLGHELHLTIDGKVVESREGEMLIEAINRAQISVPQVCYHEQLGPIQTCDTCMVEVDGKLVRACATPVRANATVQTKSMAADIGQREAFDRILENHSLYCTVCDNNNQNCVVHNTTAELAVKHQSREFRHKGYEQDLSNAFYRYDPDQCILCGRCVEACQNVQVNETLSVGWHLEQPRILWDGGHTIEGSSCVSCGHCVTVCPCNALMEKSMIGEAGYFTDLSPKVLDDMIDVVKAVEPSTGYSPILAISEVESQMRELRVKRTKTVCVYCGVGCSFDVWTKDRHILKIEPEPGPANGISTCVKGKFGWDFVTAPERLSKPLIRKGDTFVEASWEEAMDFISSRLNAIKAEHGPDAIGLIASSKCTNEESFVMQKLARAVIGTNNIDNCSRYCQTPASKGLSRTVGYGADSGSIADIEMAKLVICVGTNTSESHPVLATRVKRSHKFGRTRLIVSDLRKHEMAERSDIFLHPKPSTDPVWINAVAKYSLDNGLADLEFIHKWVNDFDAYKASLEPFTLEFAESETGIPAETIREVAYEIHRATERGKADGSDTGTCILWAMGVTQHCGGSDTSTAISNLLLCTGNYKRRGTGGYPLRGHNNVQGASDFGSMPDVFAGYQKVDDEAARAKHEAAWGVTLPTKKGLDNREMIDAIHEGKLHAMYIKGEDTITSDANANDVAQAFGKLSLFIVQDMNFSATAKFADVVLPASPSLEKDGTFTNTERRIQRLYKVFEPLGDSKPDWEIIQMIAQSLGANWNYTHPSEIMDEAARLTPTMVGVKYARLEGYNTLQWPVHADGTDTPCCYLGETPFPFADGKARFHPIEWIRPSEERNAEFDLHLNNGRLLEHFEQGAMTYQVPGIARMTPNTFVEVSPALAAERGLEDGTLVQLRSPYGQVRVRTLVTERVTGHELYMPMNSVLEPVNQLTSLHVDRATHTPAYKETAVKMTVLEAKGETPLPRENFRYGHRTPTSGVEVEQKWARGDYHVPGTRPEDKLVQIKSTQL